MGNGPFLCRMTHSSSETNSSTSCQGLRPGQGASLARVPSPAPFSSPAHLLPAARIPSAPQQFLTIAGADALWRHRPPAAGQGDAPLLQEEDGVAHGAASWGCGFAFSVAPRGEKPPARKRCFPLLGKLAALPAGEHPHLLFLSKKPTRCIIFFQFGCSVSHIAPVTGRREAGKRRLLCSCQ